MRIKELHDLRRRVKFLIEKNESLKEYNKNLILKLEKERSTVKEYDKALIVELEKIDKLKEEIRDLKILLKHC